MTRICAENERMKHLYLEWLHEARQRAVGTVDNARKAIAEFEAFTRYANFKTFSMKAAKGFKNHLRERVSAATGETLSLSTLDYTLRHIKDFFFWLAQQPGYRSRINTCDIDYFNLSSNEKKAAKAPGRRRFPSVEQIVDVIRHMPHDTEIERRNRAILAFLLLTGIRDGALVTLRMKHIRLDCREVFQDPKEVATKARKSITTFFFPVGDEVMAIFADYYEYLQKDKLFGPDDPLFPKAQMNYLGPRRLVAKGLARETWSNPYRVTLIVKEAFRSRGLSPHPPHVFRHTLASLGERLCTCPEQWKAWSLNLGHTNTRTTFDAYSHMDVGRQEAEITKFWFRSKREATGTPDKVDEMHRLLISIANMSKNESPQAGAKN